MNRPSINQVVGYVAPPAKSGDSPKIRKAIVLDAFEGDDYRNRKTVFATLDVTEYDGADEHGKPKPKNPKETIGHHTAIAAFDDTKTTENTWHFVDETAPAKSPTLKTAVQSA